MFKVIRVIILLVLVLALLAYFGVPLILRTDWAKEKVRTALEKNTDREVAIGSISFSWISGLEVENVVVKQRPGQHSGDGPLFKLAELDLGVGIGEILGKKMSIDRLAVDQPEIVIVRDRDGAMNIADLLDRPSTETPSSAEKSEVTANLTVADGRFLFLDQKLDTRIEVSELKAVAHWASGRLDLDLEFELNGGASSASGWMDLSRNPSPFRLDKLVVEGAELSANLKQLGLVIPLMGADAREASGTLGLRLEGLQANGLSGPDFSSSLVGRGEVSLDAGTLVSGPASQLHAAVKAARVVLQAIQDEDYTGLLKVRLPGMGGDGDLETLTVDHLHGTFTIANGRIVTDDTTLLAGDWKLKASGWSGLDGSLDYVFEEEALTNRYRALLKSRPDLEGLIGKSPTICYRKAVGGEGAFEIPWLDPAKLVKAQVGSKILEKGIRDRLKDLLRRDR